MTPQNRGRPSRGLRCFYEGEAGKTKAEMVSMDVTSGASNEGGRVFHSVDNKIEERPGGQPDSPGDPVPDGPRTSPRAVMVQANMAQDVQEALQRPNNSYSGVFPLFQ